MPFDNLSTLIVSLLEHDGLFSTYSAQRPCAALQVSPFFWVSVSRYIHNLGTAIVLAVFRFNTTGKLAALSQAPSEFEIVDGTPTITATRTYEDDGLRLLRLLTILV